eukprot:CAMPEP_0168453490 /NCGR_PEP_ID=MMETSP0228-20121227/49712_1 /TAXON_ID=133427 /ORGANISM="Protoceratium reticulatum, Strain CCCM 535 (=CCMP 1889)" /LENGTH=72 /DNA_ID=CAMNT_0008468207 /DNA_START=155 /DNA_END=369 /DNA_ORIENTATION=+
MPCQQCPGRRERGRAEDGEQQEGRHEDDDAPRFDAGQEAPAYDAHGAAHALEYAQERALEVAVRQGRQVAPG